MYQIIRKKIAYSSSFGIDNYKYNYKTKVYFQYYLNNFDYISVREYDGMIICKKEFNVEATHVLDPVFLIDNYNNLINKSNIKIDYDYLAVYSLRSDNELKNLIDYISNKLNLKIIIMNGENIANVEDWIYIIKNSKYFITDSFHGICFSIIFNIPFICVLNEYAGKSRIKSLSKMLRFEDRIINDITSKIDDKLIDMDFSNINEIMEVEKERSLKWLKNSLEANKILKKDYYRDNIIDLLIRENTELKLNLNKIDKLVNMIAWWIPIKKWRESFKDKFRKLY